MPHPEHDKLMLVKDRSQAVGEFMEWLAEQGLFICERGRFDDLHLTGRNREQLLADFFEIDLNVIEAEKRAMLEQLRQAS